VAENTLCALTEMELRTG